MPSLLSRLIPVYLAVTRTSRIYTSPAHARSHIEQRRVRPRPYGPPRRLRPDVTVAVEDRAGWPVYTLTPVGGASRGAVVYLHGGGWVNQIVRQHWQLVAQIAAEARMAVTVPLYPLVPFGTAEHVVAAVAELVLDIMTKAGGTYLAGDSAGGQIALSAAVRLRDHHRVVVPRTALISPALDLSLSTRRSTVCCPPTRGWVATGPGSSLSPGAGRSRLATRR